MMKRFFLLTGILCALLLFGGKAMATSFTIDNGDTNVGFVDYLYAFTTMTPSESNQYQWVNEELPYVEGGWEITGFYDDKDISWTQVDNEDYIWATDLPGAPEYYFVFIGTGGLDFKGDHFLYENLLDLNWAVIDIVEWLAPGVELGEIPGESLNVFRVSHLGEVGGTTPVPEPGLLLLLGSGLIGLAAYGRRKING